MARRYTYPLKILCSCGAGVTLVSSEKTPTAARAHTEAMARDWEKEHTGEDHDLTYTPGRWPAKWQGTRREHP